MNKELYLQKLISVKDQFSIKVIKGMRGTGKTTLLNSFVEYLKNDGAPEEQIVFINFDETESIIDFQQLYEIVNEQIIYLEHAYLIFDEIQHVKGWEKAVNAFFVGSPVDIYIAGSNEDILSADFLNLLSNNYELIKINTLPFTEYLKLFSETGNIDKIFQHYLKFGGMPTVNKIVEQEEVLPILLTGMYHTALFKDIVAPYGIRDAELIDLMNKFLARNVGNAVTPKAIDEYLVSNGRYTTGYTMDNYLQMIDKSGIFCRVKRFDIKTKATVNGSERYYCADLGICNAVLNFNGINKTALAKNLICIELWNRGYEVFVGKIGKSQVTFVAFKNAKPIYLQFAESMENKKELQRLLRPLQQINDQYDKMILSLDQPEINDFNGIKNLNFFDFLIGNI